MILVLSSLYLCDYLMCYLMSAKDECVSVTEFWLPENKVLMCEIFWWMSRSSGGALMLEKKKRNKIKKL